MVQKWGNSPLKTKNSARDAGTGARLAGKLAGTPVIGLICRKYG